MAQSHALPANHRNTMLGPAAGSFFGEMSAVAAPEPGIVAGADGRFLVGADIEQAQLRAEPLFAIEIRPELRKPSPTALDGPPRVPSTSRVTALRTRPLGDEGARFQGFHRMAREMDRAAASGSVRRFSRVRPLALLAEDCPSV
jgi:hypothetical protein